MMGSLVDVVEIGAGLLLEAGAGAWVWAGSLTEVAAKVGAGLLLEAGVGV